VPDVIEQTLRAKRIGLLRQSLRMAVDAGHPDPDDEDLLRSAADGHLLAFEALYRRYHRVVYRFARAMTGSCDAAEDVTQEVFVSLITELHRYDATRAAFTTYLYGIARNLSRERLRRERRFLSLEGLGLETRHSGRQDDPSFRIDGDESAAQVRRALRALPTRYREVILLCDLHGLAYAAAAEIVGASVGAVRARLHRGRHLLRLRLRRVLQTTPGRNSSAATCVI
jgi:RNA polymerase sigma-70 factor, ECF subfamily